MNHHAKALGESIYAVDKDARSLNQTYQRATAKELGLAETWYQQLVIKNPELVIGPCRDAIPGIADEKWHVIASEFSVHDAGNIDVLLVSEHGRIGIVETKLAYNPGNRREVLAQVLEYALAFQDQRFTKLPSMPEGVQLEDVETNIARGELLLIVAGDQLDVRALRLARGLVAGHLVNPWDLAMVDLNLFCDKSGQTLLVPELRGTVVREERQVVRVIVQGEQPQAKVKVERLPSTSASPATPWTAERFFDALKLHDVSPAVVDVAKALLDLPARFPTASVTFGSGQTGSMTIRRNGAGIFSLFSSGWAEVKTRAYLQTALGVNGAETVLASIGQHFGPSYVDSWRQPSMKQVAEHGAAIVEAIAQALAFAEGAAPSIG